MSYRGWNSKKDVIKDLARATGKKVKNFDVNCAIIGQQPPPTRSSPDEEMETQLLRLYGGDKVVCTQERSGHIGKPDLEGITQMLRMVDKYYDKPIKEQTTKQTINKENVIISISKLNPDVAEFVPKNNDVSNKENVNNILSKGCSNHQDKRSDDQVEKEKICDECNSLKGFKDTMKTNKTDDRVQVNIIDSAINTSELTPGEIEDMRKKLKTQINGTSNTNCVKVKRQRNLAIATLVKLYCQSSNTENVKPRLIAPDYYEKTLSVNDKIASIPDTIEDSSTNESKLSPNSYEDQNMTQSHDSNLNNFTQSETVVTNDMDIAASVDKVQKWLSSSETSNPITDTATNELLETREKLKTSTYNNTPPRKHATGPSVYLGTVTFKRKVNKPMSPTSSCLEEKNKIKKTSNFVPSQYANDLTKMYMERDKLKKAIENDIWTNLETELRAKDEEIKKRQLLVSETNSDPDETSVSEMVEDNYPNNIVP